MSWSINEIQRRREGFYQRFENFLVLDIETVIDEEMFNKIADEKEKEKRENGEFLPNPFHRIVAFSFLLVKNRTLNMFYSYASEDEKQLVSFFWRSFRKAHSIQPDKDTENKIKKFPVLITVNGKDFDLPVIKLRTLKYIKDIDDKENYDLKDLNIKQFISIYMDRFDRFEDTYPRYTNRFSLYHIDLAIDIFGGKKVSLKKMCYLCGIPVKQEGEGNIVEDIFKEGNLEQIARYCAEDVKATAMLFAYLNENLFDGKYKFISFDQLEEVNPKIVVI